MIAHIEKTLSIGTTKIALGSAALGPFLGFFGVPIFGVLMLILVVDFFTGLWKARVTKTMQSKRFGELLNRAFLYIVIFTITHALVGTVPTHVASIAQMMQAGLVYTEYALFFGYCLKEMLSVFENLKAIQVATGRKENAIIEAAITLFGIDLEKALKDIAFKQFKSAEEVTPSPVITPNKPEEGTIQNG